MIISHSPCVIVSSNTISSTYIIFDNCRDSEDSPGISIVSRSVHCAFCQVDETFSAQNFPQASEHELRQRRRTWQELLRRFQRHGEATAAAEGENSRGKNHEKMAGNHGKSGKN